MAAQSRKSETLASACAALYTRVVGALSCLGILDSHSRDFEWGGFDLFRRVHPTILSFFYQNREFSLSSPFEQWTKSSSAYLTQVDAALVRNLLSDSGTCQLKGAVSSNCMHVSIHPV